ncbi:hypothetical protein B5E41_23880 [Rhizobium esperanzae]|uniref:Uncharacterized protein n=1 Tax=Rhizobium esperanzae TaxID=1967781 RepID=A0A246DPS9_9HYPH|nr:hypothetical protein B5E41_23880 [Rhizobium esperanzae]
MAVLKGPNSTEWHRSLLPKDFMIAAAGGAIEHVYFPDSGLGPIVVVSPEGNKVEGGMLRIARLCAGSR